MEARFQAKISISGLPMDTLKNSILRTKSIHFKNPKKAISPHGQPLQLLQDKLPPNQVKYRKMYSKLEVEIKVAEIFILLMTNRS